MSTSTRTAPQRKAPPAPAPQPVTLVPAAAPAVTSRSRRGLLARAFEGRRGQLRLLAGLAVVACVAFAVLGAMAFADRRSALADARAQADQLVRVQAIEIDLAKADAFATNAFLAQGTGVPPADVVKKYELAVSDASRAIADAARAQPADGPALARVNDQLTDYTARVATAWAVKQDPATPTLATGYLGLASDTSLRGPTGGMLTLLDQVTKADAGRVDDAFAASDRAGLQLLVTGIAVVVVLLVVALRLALLSKRYLNVPLTAAVALVAVFTVVGALVMAGVQARTDDVKKTSYAAARALADARVTAYRAKAGESITLIRQNFVFTGNGFEDPAQKSIVAVGQQLQLADDGGAKLGADPLAAWVTVHGKVLAAVNKPDVPQALALATGAESTPGTSNNAFKTFEDVTDQKLQQESAAVDSDLTSGSWLLVVLALLALVVGVLAAVASWAGLSQRLGEYR